MSQQIKDEAGKRYGKLVVLGRCSTPDGKQGAWWTCHCDCGNTVDLFGGHLRSGSSKSCGCWRNTIDETGKVYGKLKVLRRVGRSTTRGPVWECVCVCGKVTEVRGTSLRFGSTRSCGCGTAWNKLPDGEAAFRNLYSQYRWGARSRRLEWKLDRTEFRRLTSGQCYYCGKDPQQVRKCKKSFYVYNGIDRKINSLGYLPENVVSCCWRCNSMKGSMDSREFIQFIRQVFKHTMSVKLNRDWFGNEFD